MSKYEPCCPRYKHMIHGGDYNPDQWLEHPEILKQDIVAMKKAGFNAATVGIFSWSMFEPSEGMYQFDWLKRITDDLYDNGIRFILATPSGARPAWLAKKYPEVLRVLPSGIRKKYSTRHNHCLTSPLYREKTALVDSNLAAFFKDHPGLIAWHISNEFSGECHCALCAAAFRDWLKSRYSGDLAKLNRCWYSSFWSHQISDWEEINPPTPRANWIAGEAEYGESFVHGMNLDWRRFINDQTNGFIVNEINAVRMHTPDIPVTTNMMGTWKDFDYSKMAEYLDFVSWDSYPSWGCEESLSHTASNVAFLHDLTRCFKVNKPFFLMESTPSVTNWSPYARLKRPGVHLLTSLQAIAHGSDSVQYFQWRKSRGGSEKFHGAVMDHAGDMESLVFKDVCQVGSALSRLDSVVGSLKKSDVAVIYDAENRWALEDSCGPRNDRKLDYVKTCTAHYRTFWEKGIDCDIIPMVRDFTGYRLLVAPLLYLLKPGVAERVTRFVEEGGIFVSTYWSGIVDENDLCYLDGFPGPLKKVLGIRSEVVDALNPDEKRSVRILPQFAAGLKRDYTASVLCDLIHSEGADVMAIFGDDFYKGYPALTRNRLGKGTAYYLAGKFDEPFQSDFYGQILDSLGIRPAFPSIPQGVSLQTRESEGVVFYFLMNFSEKRVNLSLPKGTWQDVVTGNLYENRMIMDENAVHIVKKTGS